MDSSWFLARTRWASRRAWTQLACLPKARFGYRIQRIVAMAPAFASIAGLEEYSTPAKPRA